MLGEVVPVPVTRYRKGIKGTLPKVPMTKLVKSTTNRHSQNADCGYQSKGLQSNPLEMAVLFDKLHSAVSDERRKQLQGLYPSMYEAWVNSLQGFAPSSAYVVVREVELPLAPRILIYGCETKPVTLGTPQRLYNEVNNNPIAVRQERETWKKNRTPRVGVRPTVRIPQSR